MTMTWPRILFITGGVLIAASYAAIVYDISKIKWTRTCAKWDTEIVLLPTAHGILIPLTIDVCRQRTAQP
jgi:hypothetical protein